MAKFIDIATSIKGYAATIKFLQDIPAAVELAERYTISDLRGRIPPIVSREVVKVYNIQRKEVKPKSLKTGFYMENGIKRNSAGRLRIRGAHLASLRFVYEGRLLTPVHFAMRPTSASMNPPTPYTIKMKVFKGQRRTKIGQHLGRPPVRPNPHYPKSGYILFPTGAKSGDKTSHIPIQRNLPGHRPTGDDAYSKFTTVSMPQMVSSEYTQGSIQQAIGEMASKRMTHQLERVVGI